MVRPSAAPMSHGRALEVPISQNSYRPPGGNSVAARAIQDRFRAASSSMATASSVAPELNMSGHVRW
eukprot:1554788-Alexandrium_andersonii.AAC.1